MIIIWYDDIRKPPPIENIGLGEHEIIWCRTNEEAQTAMATYSNNIRASFLDHDMGLHNEDPEADPSTYIRDYRPHHHEHDGYRLVQWMIANNINAGTIFLHSWNPVGAKRMRVALIQGNYDLLTGYSIRILPFKKEWYDIKFG